MIKAVLFDLDGTFADTAPDLCYALNLMREARKLAPVPLEATRPVTSLGALGASGSNTLQPFALNTDNALVAVAVIAAGAVAVASLTLAAATTTAALARAVTTLVT
jgi:phosphoglycolate phosphatase-like HAD superfamily hydrolase